jgi:putative SOS response-associated peptidase YedK
MCGRVTLTVPAIEAVAEVLGAEVDPAQAAAYAPSTNVAPSEMHWMLRRSNDRRRLERAAWGFTLPEQKRLFFNARGETAARIGLFRAAWERRRCVIPTDGFYEWSGPPGDRRPTWFRAPDEGLLWMAGLFDERDGTPRFTILTTQSSGLVAALHDRMPVLLRPDQVDTWLDTPDEALVRPAPLDALIARPASPSVNGTRRAAKAKQPDAMAVDSPAANAVIEARPSAKPSIATSGGRAARQLSLFDK